MNSTKRVKRSRDNIDVTTISALLQSITKIITEYKSQHSGAIEEFTHRTTIGILDHLQRSIQETAQSQKPDFEKFTNILQFVYSAFDGLDNELEINLIGAFQTLLANQLRVQAEADWEEEQRDQHYKSQDLDGQIQYSLSCLNKAKDYFSHEDQMFSKKWQVYGERPREQYSIWVFLINEFECQIKNNYTITLLSELRIQFGLLNKLSVVGREVKQEKQYMGALEKIILNADKEILGLQKKHQCETFGAEQEKIVKALSSKKENEFKNAENLVKNQDKLGSIIQKMIKELGELDSDNGVLNDSQCQIYQKIKKELNLQMNLYKLKGLITKARVHIQGLTGFHDKQELISEIAKNEVFSEEIKEQVEKLGEQLFIWTLENLTRLCHEFLLNYAESIIDTGKDGDRMNLFRKELYDNPGSYLVKEFLSPLIHDLINPLLYIFNKKEISFDMNALIKEFRQTYIVSFNEANSKTKNAAVKSVSSPCQQKNQSHDDNKKIANQREQQALKAVSHNQVSQSLKDEIAINSALQMALSAAYLYTTTALGRAHGGDGKEATLLFIKNILGMDDKSLLKIQNEALKYIKGERGYGTWYGGGSSYNNHSRISFILNSGLLDDRKGEIFPYKTSTRVKFFDHTNHPFETLPEAERKDLTKRVSSLY